MDQLFAKGSLFSLRVENVLQNRFLKTGRKLGLVLLLLAIFSVSGFEARAGEVAVGSDAHFVNITPFLDYYEDPGGKLGIQDVASGEIYGRFKPVGSDVFHAGLSPSSYWFRVKLGLSQGSDWGGKWLLEIPRLNLGEVSMYVPDFTKPGGFGMVEEPNMFSCPDRPFLFQNIVFPLSFRMAGKTVFFQVKSKWSVSLPVYVWEEGEYGKELSRRAVTFSLACGFMLGAVAFGMFALSGRNWKSVAVFVSYTVLWVCFLFNVCGYSVLFFSRPCALYRCTGLILCGMGVASILLAICLLKLSRYVPKLYRLGLGLLPIFAIAGLLSLSLPQAVNIKLAAVCIALAGSYNLCASVVRVRQKSRSAFWYLISCISLYGSCLLFLGNGLLWPNIPEVQNFLIFGISLSSLFICRAITVEYGILELKQIRHGISEDGRDLYDISTGLHSQGYFISRFTEEMNHSYRVGQPLSLLLIDIDHLRHINEEYGVLFSDQVIVRLGEVIKNNSLCFSVAGRLEGGLFALQLPEAYLGKALEVAEKIRGEFSEIKFSTVGLRYSSQPGEAESGPERFGEDGDAVQFSVCIGAVEVMAEERHWEEVLRRAQGELKKAKQAGVGNISPGPDLKALL